MIEDLKVCLTCKQAKPLSEYSKHRGRTSGLIEHCKPCNRATQNAKWANNPVHMARVDKARLCRKIGITLAEFDALHAAQGGRCAICTRLPNGRGDLHMDHDHETNTFRGLICHSCNVSLGLMGDDPDRLIRAAEYLIARRNVLTLVREA